MSDLAPFLFFAAGLGVIALIHVLTGKSDRKRILDHIEAHGGRLVEILRAWGGGSRYERAYDVTYMTAADSRVKARCRTNMSSGVYWLNRNPPGFSVESEAKISHPLDLNAEEPSGPPEAIRCLDCGTIIPADEIRCPQCGWSYKG